MRAEQTGTAQCSIRLKTKGWQKIAPGSPQFSPLLLSIIIDCCVNIIHSRLFLNPLICRHAVAGAYVGQG